MLMNRMRTSLIISIFPRKYRKDIQVYIYIYIYIYNLKRNRAKNLHFRLYSDRCILLYRMNGVYNAIRVCLLGVQAHCVAWVLIEVALDEKSDNTGDKR